MRRSHHRAGTQLFAEDKKSGELRRPHHIDLSTGMYRGKQIIIKKTKENDELKDLIEETEETETQTEETENLAEDISIDIPTDKTDEETN